MPRKEKQKEEPKSIYSYMDAIPQNFRVPTSKESDLMAMVTPKTKPKTIQVSPERETLHSVNNNHNYNINKNDGFAISRVKSPSDLVLLIRRKKFNEAEQLLLNSSGLIMAQRADVFGDLPLHDALSSGAPDSLIFSLLSAFPEAVFHKNDELWLPIHFAVCRKSQSKSSDKATIFTSSNTLKLLISKNPQSLEECDTKGRTPRDLAMWMKHHKFAYENSASHNSSKSSPTSVVCVLSNHIQEVELQKCVQVIFQPVSKWIEYNLEHARAENKKLQSRMCKQEEHISSLKQFTHAQQTEIRQANLQNDELRQKTKLFQKDNSELRKEVEEAKKHIVKLSFFKNVDSFHDSPKKNKKQQSHDVSTTEKSLNDILQAVDKKFQELDKRLVSIEHRLFFS